MKNGWHDGLCSYSLLRNFPSVAVPAESIKAAFASFDLASTTFFSVKRQ
jgi:hypothetical protein